MKFTLIIFQILNILLNEFETGTQGSIDGYIVSLYIGIILSIAIILLQIFKIDQKNDIKTIFFILLIFSLLLYIPNFKYLYYVTINGYSINDVIVGAVGTDFANYIKNIGDRIYPIIFYVMITINVIICLIIILKKNKV